MWCSGNVSFLSVEVKHFELKEAEKRSWSLGWVTDFVNHNCIKSLRTSYFSIIITFVGSHFSSLLFWLKSIDTFWLGRRKLEYDDQFTAELFVWNLKKEKNSLQKLSLETEISKPESFGWNRTNINSLFVIHCYIMHSRYSLTPCKGLGVWKMRHPKIVVTIKANLIQWKSQIKLPILALPKLYKEFTTHKNHTKPFLNTQYTDTLMHMHTHKLSIVLMIKRKIVLKILKFSFGNQGTSFCYVHLISKDGIGKPKKLFFM